MTQLITITEPRTTTFSLNRDQRRVRKREPGPRPPWLTVRYSRNRTFSAVEDTKTGLGLVTVCEEAMCPNIDECWSAGTATFMLMGDICTRRCGFCAVQKGMPRPLDGDEPRKIAEAIATMGVQHAVITSVNRDELPDGGAAHIAATVDAIRELVPATTIELLIPDHLGQRDAIEHILDSGPDIVAHNMETVARLYRRVRPQAQYQRSLDVLNWIGQRDGIISKTGLMMGLGETNSEVFDVMQDLRAVDCEIFTVGQYLSPTTRHLPVERWVTPDTFDEIAELGRQLGFSHVESGPLVRSSYMAHRAIEH
ncbi:MAG: lipoyl synthase [Myxococcales bacterium]|nr:lipoyl synthase [Myxococcales bacterium]